MEILFRRRGIDGRRLLFTIALRLGFYFFVSLKNQNPRTALVYKSVYGITGICAVIPSSDIGLLCQKNRLSLR